MESMDRTPVNNSEQDERGYLERIMEKLKEAMEAVDKSVNSHAKEIKAFKDYLWENKDSIDPSENGSFRQSITQTAFMGENVVNRKKRLRKLLSSPYFGRIDFINKEEGDRMPIYIGVHSFVDNLQNDNLIYDWRAPVSTMFYDFEYGEAYYDSPSGTISGEIVLKRQYRIRLGKMEFMLENALNMGKA